MLICYILNFDKNTIKIENLLTANHIAISENTFKLI